MEFEQILKLIDHVSASRLESFCYENDGLKITLNCEKKNSSVVLSGNTDGSQKVVQIVSETENNLTSADTEGVNLKAPSVSGNIVKSPLVGTFYAAPSEDAAPFVKVGDKVKKGQVLAIVEAMKLMNDIESDFDGEIIEILVENGQSVEYGQPLFSIR